MTAFRFAAFEFRPRLWTGIAALAGIALTLVLAQWQLGRAQYKEDLQKRYELLGRQPAVNVGGRAAGLDLRVHDKPDSQEICFVPDGDYARVVEEIRPGAARAGLVPA